MEARVSRENRGIAGYIPQGGFNAMKENLLAKSSIAIHATPQRIWEALTTPAQLKEWFFGTDVITDWKVGSPILYRGMWQGKPFEDKGKILKVERPSRLESTHFSPLTGQPDVPENYHTVTYTITPHGDHTDVTITNDNNADEEGVKHSEQTWQMALDALKKYLEK
jgi:uncharacterized protein YndB with AHSA1/START domain